MTDTFISIVVVNYYSSKKVERLINSIKDNCSENFELIIVDNSESIEELALLKRLKSNAISISIVDGCFNGGFSYGTNLGIGKRSKSSTHVFILNPDTTLMTDSIQQIIHHCSAINDMAISPTGLYLDNNDYWSCGGGFYWIRGRADVLSSEKNSSETKFGTCAALIVPEKILNDVGLLDEDFFLGGEEWDYSKRIRDKGYSILYSSNITYRHEVSGTHQKYGLIFFYIGLRTKVLFTKKHYGFLFYPWLVFLLLPVSGILSARYSNKNNVSFLNCIMVSIKAIMKSQRGIKMTKNEVDQIGEGIK